MFHHQPSQTDSFQYTGPVQTPIPDSLLPILYKWVPQFRIYGRAGVVAVGIWSLVVPLILSRFSDRYLPGKWRVWFAVCCLIPALWDGWRAREALRLPDAKATLNIPGWVPWLAEQPSQVRAAIFPVVPEENKI